MYSTFFAVEDIWNISQRTISFVKNRQMMHIVEGAVSYYLRYRDALRSNSDIWLTSSEKTFSTKQHTFYEKPLEICTNEMKPITKSIS